MVKINTLVQNSVLFFLVAVCKSQVLPMLEFLKLPTSSSSFSEFVAQEWKKKSFEPFIRETRVLGPSSTENLTRFALSEI